MTELLIALVAFLLGFFIGGETVYRRLIKRGRLKEWGPNG
jgi:hypothetical protein